ncbi:hypothetical protein PI126_g8448 [Phytophthora idaei]|nr:hypothetical protein PI126_g8448 [Phytophthora idaei]
MAPGWRQIALMWYLRSGEVSGQAQRMMKEGLDPAQEVGNLFGDVPTNMTVVKVPRQEALQAGLWLVSGSIDNALDTKGIRFRVYRLAGAYLGYCDPVRRIGLCTMV